MAEPGTLWTKLVISGAVRSYADIMNCEGAMQIDIRSNIREVMADVAEIHRRHIPFATIYGLTLTGRDVKDEEVSVMKRVFDRPTPYTLNALWAWKATRNNPVSTVEFKTGGGTPAKRFLNPEVHGGLRSQRSSERQIAPLLRGYGYLVPARGTPLNAYGNVTGGTMRKVISQLKVSSDPTANASGSKRSKRKRKTAAFFVPKRGNMVMERKGDQVKPFLIAVRAPHYRKRFPFYETAERVVAARMDKNFTIALERAISTGNFKGKWS